MELYNKKRFKDDVVIGFNNNVCIILLKIEGIKRNLSFMGLEIYFFIISVSLIIFEMDDDSDFDEMVF